MEKTIVVNSMQVELLKKMIGVETHGIQELAKANRHNKVIMTSLDKRLDTILEIAEQL